MPRKKKNKIFESDQTGADSVKEYAQSKRTKKKNIWMQSFSGQIVNLEKLEDNKNALNIVDISHHLSLINRFNGATSVPYNVAQHSINVADLVSEESSFWGLMHDVPETWLGDLISPVKALSGKERRNLEYYYSDVIIEEFGINVTDDIKEEVNKADLWMVHEESRQLMKETPEWNDYRKFLRKQLGDIFPEVKITPWSWEESKRRFSLKFQKLYNTDYMCA